VTGVTVTAKNSSTGVSLAAKTSDSGSYLISNVTPGTYSVTSEAAGFQRSVVENVAVNAGSTSQVNITLTVAAASMTVEVSSDRSVMETTNASASSTVITQQIVGLPIGGRKASLIALDPRVSVVTKSGTNEDNSTPRLREYFPETLLWQPELIT